MPEISFQPGVVATPTSITIPAYAQGIGKITHAMILRNDHSHVSFQIQDSAVAADALAFVPIQDGTHSALTTASKIASAGGAADFDVPSSANALTPLVVAVTATRVDSRTISLSVSTEAKDIVVLDYQEIGLVTGPYGTTYVGMAS